MKFFSGLTGTTASIGAMFLTAAVAASFSVSFDDLSLQSVTLDDNVGDSFFVDLSNQTRAAFGNSKITKTSVDSLTTITPLRNVAFPGVQGDVGEFSFLIAAGQQLTLDSFDVAASPANADATFRVYDANWNEVWSQSGAVKSGQKITPGVSLTNGGYLQFGTSGRQVSLASTRSSSTGAATGIGIGIDNLTYSVVQANDNADDSNAPAAVTQAPVSTTAASPDDQVLPTPLPASAGFVLLGLGGLVALRRRKN